MKKIALFVMMFVGIAFANAQNYDTLYMPQDVLQNAEFYYCANEFDGVIIYGESGWNCRWRINSGEYIYDDHIVLLNTEYEYHVSYTGSVNRYFHVFFPFPIQESPFIAPIRWKRQGEAITLTVEEGEFDYYEYEYLWSNGSIEWQIEVTEPSAYSVTITSIHGCGSNTFSIEVRDNVELYRATVDLGTNLNKATWQVTPEQAQYISDVKVYRDGLLVGTAPYEQGYYLDAIGSDNAARNYQIVGVSVEGEDCPIASYEKGTIHTTYYQDVNNNLNMTWNIPYVEEGAQGALTYFQICKYDPNTGDLTVVDQVNSSITDYTCGVNQFDGGYAVIAAVFSNGKNMEELSFSNLTTEILGVDENGPTCFRVYPNPAKDRITIEGNGIMTITNALGQIIMTKGIDGKETFELPQGIYFVKLNGTTRKVVVE